MQISSCFPTRTETRVHLTELGMKVGRQIHRRAQERGGSLVSNYSKWKSKSPKIQVFTECLQFVDSLQSGTQFAIQEERETCPKLLCGSCWHYLRGRGEVWGDGLHFRFQTALSFGIHVLQEKSGKRRIGLINSTRNVISTDKDELYERAMSLTDVNAINICFINL
jgi:hypothetical protein